MSDRRHLLAILVLVVAGAVGCSDASRETVPSAVEIEIEIEGGRRWVASRTSVESGLICEGGSHRLTGFRSQDGSEIDYYEAAELKRMQPALVLIETQLGCSDGTGAISIAWEPDEDDRWLIVGGSGAYSGATGGGRVERGEDGLDGPMVVRGTVSAK